MPEGKIKMNKVKEEEETIKRNLIVKRKLVAKISQGKDKSTCSVFDSLSINKDMIELLVLSESAFKS